jgi:type IV pilus assembly protein PilB
MSEFIANLELSAEQVHLLKPEQAWYYRIVPLAKEEGILKLLIDSNQDISFVKSELKVIFDLNIDLKEIETADMERLLHTYYFKNNEKLSNRQIKELSSQQTDFIPKLIAEAKALKSSDIHIEIYEKKCRIRIRIDGNLIERYHIPVASYPSIINKIKILANLDIAEKRLPQDGRIHFKEEGMSFDIRVSVLPTLYGEKIVLRLLNQDAAHIQLNQLGFAKEDLKNYLEGVKKPHGMLLISGPTGSGKTTTLYATLKLLNKENRNILTVEDPVEYTLDGINQVQLKEDIGLNFAASLRTFLRQDPDVIMVGEIRDADTANMAIRASLTGHLVLSTIHTNSAWGTISRLIDMGIPPFLIAGTLNTSVAQRLIRKLCPHCKQQITLDAQLFPRNFKPYKIVNHHFIQKGCEKCFYTGYKGRVAIYEVISLDHELAEQVKVGNMNVDSLLRERGIKTLGENAFSIFEKGETTLEEIYSLLYNI